MRHVYLPSATAWVLGNPKVPVGFAFTGACVGEFAAATARLGYLLGFARSRPQLHGMKVPALILLITCVVVMLILSSWRPAGWNRHPLRWN